MNKESLFSFRDMSYWILRFEIEVILKKEFKNLFENLNREYFVDGYFGVLII